jgi:ATP-dependent Clp protease ATP-binding subunit ClpC
VDFRNAMIVMTSNVGAEMIKRQTQLGFTARRDEEQSAEAAYQAMREKLLEQLRKIFRPEFLNRVDGVIVFRSLSKDEITQIVDLELGKVQERLKEHALTLEATPEAKQKLADEGYDPEFGARPLRRVIQNRVEDALSDALLAGKFRQGDTVIVDVDESGAIVLRRKEGTEEPGALEAALEGPVLA